MLPIEYAGHSIMAILDGGAGMAIVTKEVWELWGKPNDEANTHKAAIG